MSTWTVTILIVWLEMHKPQGHQVRTILSITGPHTHYPHDVDLHRWILRAPGEKNRLRPFTKHKTPHNLDHRSMVEPRDRARFFDQYWRNSAMAHMNGWLNWWLCSPAALQQSACGLPCTYPLRRTVSWTWALLRLFNDIYKIGDRTTYGIFSLHGSMPTHSSLCFPTVFRRFRRVPLHICPINWISVRECRWGYVPLSDRDIEGVGRHFGKDSRRVLCIMFKGLAALQSRETRAPLYAIP